EAVSSDGFRTVDLQLASVEYDSERCWTSKPSFVRVEIRPETRRVVSESPKVGQIARISGQLMWDGDGFLEIHPFRAGDIEIDIQVHGTHLPSERDCTRSMQSEKVPQ